MSLWHVPDDASNFSTQGIINRAFFDQRAEKDLLEDSRLSPPARSILGVPGRGSAARAKDRAHAEGLVSSLELIS